MLVHYSDPQQSKAEALPSFVYLSSERKNSTGPSHLPRILCSQKRKKIKHSLIFILILTVILPISKRLAYGTVSLILPTCNTLLDLI